MTKSKRLEKEIGHVMESCFQEHQDATVNQMNMDYLLLGELPKTWYGIGDTEHELALELENTKS